MVEQSPTKTNRTQDRTPNGALNPVEQASVLSRDKTGSGPTFVPTVAARTLRVAVYRCLVDDGLTAGQAAKRLHKSSSLIGYHVRALLSQGAIRHQPGSEGAPVRFYSKGSRADLYLATLMNKSGDKTKDRGVRSADRTPAVAHRGHRAFPVLAAPMDPSRVAGWEKVIRPSGVETHYFRHRDADGRSWRFQFTAGRARRSVTAYPPHVTLYDSATVAAIPDWWEPWVEKEAHRWARDAGFQLAARSGRATQPVEVAIPAPGMAPTRDGHLSEVKVDRTPFPEGSLEGPPAIIAAVMRAPDTEVRVGMLERRMAAVLQQGQAVGGVLDKLVTHAEGNVAREAKVANVLVAHAERDGPGGAYA